jgi:DNA-binding SARP family transcriptional activator
MEFRLLGPFEVLDGGRRLALGPRKQRAVLALLALEANRAVSLDRLIDELWGEAPPAAATGSLQAYVSNLRRLLEPQRAAREPPRRLVTRAPGYVLHVDLEDHDVARFESASGEGRRLLAAGRPAEAWPLLERALGEWRGAALADFAYEPFAQAPAARLEELRLVTIEHRLQADLDLGAHAEVVVAAQALVRAHPLREGLWGLYMVGLYRCGRQAEALRAYQSARLALGEELGIEPGPGLRRLESEILGQVPTLDWRPPVPSETGVPALVTTTSYEATSPLTAGGDALPLVGRTHELARLEDFLARARSGHGGAVLVEGEPGVGKSRLIAELASRAGATGMAVGRGGALEGAGTPPYWTWVGVVRDLLSSSSTDDVAPAL